LYKFYAKAKTSLERAAKKRLLYKKARVKTLMKLTPGVNFTNILSKAFTHADPKSTKYTAKSTVFFALLGLAMLVKLILRVNPII